LPDARYLVFRSFQTDREGREYYELLDLAEARYPQTILAYAMNGEPLSVTHGAPLRLRMETKLGFKMVKWLRSIEVVKDHSLIGQGQGGYREDVQYYDLGAQI
jgi:DMSO/TMAO reductase YedYZ molybdopterin-dependent catalytic subunit